MDADHEICARTIAGEADDQPQSGQSAVAHVLVNRLRTGRWGGTFVSVCLWPLQFDCWVNRVDCERILGIARTDSRLLLYAHMVDEALGESDQTRGSLYYKLTNAPWPNDWGPVVRPTLTIGVQSFYVLEE
jgi:spore germination cell wall hydrolase CwlJ-like protein